MLTLPQVQRDVAQGLSDRVDRITASGQSVKPISPTLLSSDQLCCYLNNSSQVQVIRVEDVRAFFERVVLPGQRLLFEAPLHQMLKVYYGRVAVLQVDEIACHELQVRFE
jgi:hypothetical protein